MNKVKSCFFIELDSDRTSVLYAWWDLDGKYSFNGNLAAKIIPVAQVHKKSNKCKKKKLQTIFGLFWTKYVTRGNLVRVQF